MSDARKMGEHIRRLRLAKQMSLSELARQATISKAYLSQLERGQVASPSADVLYKLASVLGTSVAALLGRAAGADEPAVAISESLRGFAKEARLSDEEMQMLARIRLRGKQPRTKSDWRYLYESIKRSIPESG